MTSYEIRQAFLNFMESKGHMKVPSAPMVVKNDPTLMFTNAGMNQFKDIFLGDGQPKSTRLANSQKCLRVSGKHNDLEEVGVDTYHHTMFEMLGNWSFGDYFKKGAIEWAWELLTEVYKIPKDKLYVTVFGGDAADGLDRDKEAADIWENIIDADRILDCDKTDNFWEMGETGPCGPCSEIHIDIRSDEERAAIDGRSLVNKDDPKVIEIWNLVFMEHNRIKDGSLHPLPAKHIDTGMGFERLTTALQQKESNYDTDIFSPLIDKIVSLTGVKYERSDEKKDIAIRVISDHVRAVSFAIADGQLPSNTGAGYVIRRILRRAIRYAYSFLDMKEAFIFELVSVLSTQMGDHFPEIKEQRDLIGKVIKEEEESFLRTLEKGIQRLDDIIKASEKKTISGEKVFELYDTYGFPLDLTALILGERGYDLDKKGFESELAQQKDRSRSDSKIDKGDWVVVKEDDVEEFVGYDQLESELHITRYRKIEQKGQTKYQLVFNLTPFYAEGGGQVGDTGTISSKNDTVTILDTKKENGLILHFVDELPGNLNDTFDGKVDASRRAKTEKNHSVTHLMHHALREILGDHVQQKGSLVHPDGLRFDFSHFSKVNDGEIRQIEDRVNQLIRANAPLEEGRNTPMQEAIDAGAMALFGEKYGDVVRTIRFGESIELCGGTHVSATGNIGLFKISSESAIASGVRRIEALTGEGAIHAAQALEDSMSEVRELLKNPADLTKAVADLLSKNSQLTKELEKFNKNKASGLKDELKNKVQEIGGINFIAEKVDVDSKSIKDIAFQLKAELSNLFLVLGADHGGKVGLTIAVSDELIKDKGLNAGSIIRDLAKHIGGGGGGQPGFASAGGSDVSGLEAAFAQAKTLIE